MANRNKNTIKRETKKEIYASFGIQFDGKKILAPVFGWIRPVLKKGNTKIGKVWAWSMLPREIAYTFTWSGKEYNICGTCWGTCKDPDTGEITCYACAGHYQRQSVRASLGINTFLARYCLDFLERAIKAQIEADNIQVCRVHVAGDFFSDQYVEMWQRVAESFPAVCFWTYTKNAAAESAFDFINNFHVVRSRIPGHGYNFGHCDYVIAMYDMLTAAGYKVYICKCGFDKESPTHCDTCAACRSCDFVLFLEHSTSYKAEQDPLYPVLRAIVLNQSNDFEAAA